MGSKLGQWIPNEQISSSKPLGDSSANLAFHHSKVDQMSTRNSCEFSGKKNKLSPRKDSVTLRQLNPIQRNRQVFLMAVFTYFFMPQ